MAQPSTTLFSHGEVDSSVKETYGRGTAILRIGNGGAGATGLLEALAKDYLDMSSGDGSIQWICNHSRNTQSALFYGYIDLALTYERDQEALAAAEGWSATAGCVFHDHFCLAGPASDPANVASVGTLEDAFLRIARSAALFYSRVDGSATMWKERNIWTNCGIKPWEDAERCNTSWYRTNLLSPSEALISSDAAGAYLLIDRSTLLRQTYLRTVYNTTVFFEPKGPDDVLMNSCYALISTRAPAERVAAVSNFLTYLYSERGQNVIADFGKEELGGFTLFAPVKKGFASSFLRGGIPRDGLWRQLNARPKI